MKQRPIACLALLVFLILQLIPAGFFYEYRQISEKCEAQVTGQVSRWTIKDEKMQICLTDCQVQSVYGQFKVKQMLVYTEEIQEYPVGTDLSLSGTIYPIEEPTNPGQFNSRLYYGAKGISYTLYAKRSKALALHPAPVREGLLSLSSRFGDVYKQVLNEKDSGLIQAMILGHKEDLDTEVKELYQRNGISHVLAISGLHLSLVGMGFYRLLRKITGSYIWSGIPSIVFLLSYAWMTGSSISAVRAAIMCSMAILADLIGRTYDMLTAIGLSALTLMVINPLNARQSAFLLSFGAVLAIALFSPIWKLYKKKTGQIRQALSVSISVLMITFPILLCTFYEYPLYSTLLNLLVIPLMSLLMICGILCGLSGLVCVPLARALAVPCRMILEFYEWTGRKCLAFPGALLTIGNPSVWKLMLYYMVLTVGLILLYREKRRKKYWRKQEKFRPHRYILYMSLCPLFLCLCLLCVRVRYGLEIYMLDVGQGDSLFFRTPEGITCLYDSGSSNVKQVGAFRLLPFLKWSGVGRLDYLFISHMDQDHINGVKELVEDSRSSGGIRIEHAVFPKLSMKDEAYEEMEALFLEAGIPVHYMGTGDMLYGEKFSLTCLYPKASAVSEDRNDLSLVLMAEYGDFQMLFTGDIGKATEAELVSSGLLREIEILKTAHHGSRHSSTAAFLEKTKPVVSLISCSATNRYGHPGEETLQRLKEAGSKVYVTRECGAIRVWTDGKNVQVKSIKDSTGEKK